ncbi:MAG: hypothetical protein RL266_1841 [Bacteroidota bacterium]|jgi:effector-binding domain-containing protein
MKALKVIGIILLVLVGAYVVAALVAPSVLKVEKTIVVNVSPDQVYPHVACFKNWEPWNPWDAMDTTNTNEFSEQACGVGSWYTWKGKKTGEGRQDVLEARDNEYIKCSLVFGMDPTPQTSEWFFEAVDGGTKVTWNFIGTEASFFQKPMNLMGEYFLGEAYTSGLAALKEVAEASPAQATPSFDIQTIELGATNYLLVSGDVKPQDIAMYYTENFGKIMAYMEQKKAAMAGYPTGLYFNWTDTLAQMAAAIPVAAEVAGTDIIEFRQYPAGKALLIEHYGNYDEVGPAHYAIEAYSNSNGVNLVGYAIEQYVTDPESEPDTSKWLTRIVYPIAAE